MAITTADGWFAAARQKVRIHKVTSGTAVAANPSSAWDQSGSPGNGSFTVGNTANGVVPTDTTAGAPLIVAFAGGATGYLAAARFRNSVAGSCILYDRLYHAGSFSLATLQTFTLTSQPSISGRVPGGTDYNNLEILLEVGATTISASAVTITVTYTNESGTTGRSTGATSSLASFLARRIVNMPLQAGDTGVQKIETVVVGGATAASGTINVIIARRLAVFDVRIANGADIQGWDVIGGPQVFADSCLFPVISPDSTGTGLFTLDMDIISG